MCGRYTAKHPYTGKVMYHDPSAMRMRADPKRIFPRYNIAPTQRAAVITLEPDGVPAFTEMRWGLVPFWSKTDKEGARMINARSETVATLPAYRAAFKARRCLVVADGFYEWIQTAKPKQPLRFVMEDPKAPMYFAGIWESWKPAADAEHPLQTFSILTTTPNPLVEPVHDRMPVILPEHTWEQWLDPQAKPEHLQALLVPYTATPMKAYKVTPLMNSPKYEDPAATEPLRELL